MEDTEAILLHLTIASIVTLDPVLGPILPVSTGTTDGLLDSTAFCVLCYYNPSLACS